MMPSFAPTLITNLDIFLGAYFKSSLQMRKSERNMEGQTSSRSLQAPLGSVGSTLLIGQEALTRWNGKVQTSSV